VRGLAKSLIVLGLVFAANTSTRAAQSTAEDSGSSEPEFDEASLSNQLSPLSWVPLQENERGPFFISNPFFETPDPYFVSLRAETANEIELLQQLPPLRPQQPIEPMPPAMARPTELSAALFGTTGVDRSLLSASRRDRSQRPATDVVVGAESRTRPASDTGSLLGRTQSTHGIGVQKRTPIVTDVRARGDRTGQLLASGSYWMPARQDLDTILSKLDSSLISDVIAIKGPYSALYGPGFSFIDTALVGAPRYPNGEEWHGRTWFDYQTNGQQWHGHQTIMGGSTDWGIRADYGHRTGNDYESGDGSDMPSSYKSRDVFTVIGLDLTPDSHIEFSYLRLDQTDVEFPGQIFDMEFLVTDGYELKYVLENQLYFDQLSFDAWYNRTRFEGNAQRSGKRRQIPELNCPPDPDPCFYGAPRRPGGVLGLIGHTDVDQASTGFRLATSWGELDDSQLTVGVDLRYLKQRLNEFDNFQFSVDTDGDGVFDFFDPFGRGPGAGPPVNLPIPRSHASNPGLFLENAVRPSDDLVIRAGGRVDWVATNAAHFVDGADINDDGLNNDNLEPFLGERFNQHFDLWSAFVTAEYDVNCHWKASAGFGYAERPPTLTELYAVQSFLAILQQGFSFVTGDPGLNPERLWQIDLGLRADYGDFRAGIHGFHAWVRDFITYESTLSNVGGVVDALGVTFVNTDLATLAGGEIYGEYDWNSWLTPFASLSYVEGRDHSRGNRGTNIQDANGNDLEFSDEEPLPGIAPLESRFGFRIHEPVEKPRWGLELAARVVDNQDRIASSLLERETSGFTTWDFRSYWQATDCLLLVAGVENFTDKNYREHLDLRTGTGVLQPGTNFYTGLELRY